MPEKMRAIVKTKPEPGAEMMEVDTPQIALDEVLVKVNATSICGTDVHIYEWDAWSQGRIKIPQTMGHEFSGEVVEVGANCKKIKVGDVISAETHIPCLDCINCLTGQMHICSNLKILGVDCNGCFAEYAAVPELVCWRNDPEVPPEFLCVQEPLGNALYCTLVTPITGQNVLIIGDGPIALFAAGVARVGGAAQIFQVYRHEYRSEIASKMGADVVINGHEDDVEQIVKDGTDGFGADVVLEMAGSQAAIDTALKCVRKGGRVSAFGVAKGPVEWDYNNGLVFKGATVYGINGRLMYDTWVRVSNLLRHKKLDISPVVTHKLPLDDFEHGFSLMMTRPKVSGKVVLFP